MARVLEDSMHTHDKRQWEGLEEMVALSAAGDVDIPELEMVKAEEVMEEEPAAALHRAWWASSGAGRARLRRWPRPWGA